MLVFPECQRNGKTDPPSSLEAFWSLLKEFPKKSIPSPLQLRLGRFNAEAKRCVNLKKPVGRRWRLVGFFPGGGWLEVPPRVKPPWQNTRQGFTLFTFKGKVRKVNFIIRYLVIGFLGIKKYPQNEGKIYTW